MVDFIRTNPTAEVMQREGARADTQRDAEEAAFMRRNQFEQANAADAAVRAGIGAYYAQPQPDGAPAPQQPGMTPVAPQQPTPTPAPAQTATMPLGAPPVTVTIGHPPATGKEPVPLPPGQDQGFGDAEPLPADQAQAGSSTPAARPTGAPTPGARSSAAPVAAAAGGFKPIISEMIKAPGTGTAAMSLFTADQHQRAELAKLDRQTRLDGMKEFLASVKDGDAQLARFTATQYGLGVPDEFFTNRAHMMRASVAAKTAEHLFGKDNPQQTLAYVQGYLEAGPNATPDQASLSGLTKVKATGMGGKVAGHYVDEKNNVQFYDRHGQDPQDPTKTLPKARPQKWQVPGPGGSSVFEKKQAAYLRVHPGDDQGALDYASGRKVIAPQQLRNWVEAAVAREEGKRVRPFTPEERRQTRAYYEDAFGINAGSSTPKPQPGGARPGTRPPLSSFNRTGATVDGPPGEGAEAD